MLDIAPFRVWSQGSVAETGLEFVPEMSTVEVREANAAKRKGRTFFHHPVGRGRRLASGSVWTVPTTRVQDERFLRWARQRHPDVDRFHLVGATHYMGGGHRSIASIFNHILGHPDVGDIFAAHVWSGEISLEEETIHVNMTSRLGFKNNQAKQSGTKHVPELVPQVFAQLMQHRKLVPHDFDPQQEHFAQLPEGYDPRHSSLMTNIGVVKIFLRGTNPSMAKRLFVGMGRGVLLELHSYFQVAQVLVHEDPQIYGREVCRCVDALVRHLKTCVDLAPKPGTTDFEFSERLRKTLTKVLTDLEIFYSYHVVDVTATPTIPLSPHKIFDVFILPG